MMQSYESGIINESSRGWTVGAADINEVLCMFDSLVGYIQEERDNLSSGSVNSRWLFTWLEGSFQPWIEWLFGPSHTIQRLNL